eukprot:TRINITY_DN43908_c0_g1_i1.p2 TRINITY_DN43908_c0_g1~~TRINITY_DN43908_c0_g1_i1.p2  ORF type:complete len:109 (-),score=22.94 TRINITY_DN43908_c0_g1_i1:18-344(-)
MTLKLWFTVAGATFSSLYLLSTHTRRDNERKEAEARQLSLFEKRVSEMNGKLEVIDRLSNEVSELKAQVAACLEANANTRTESVLIRQEAAIQDLQEDVSLVKAQILQ